ncbi:unnamed protein product [Trichobilharzia regenti]|nr:unnamed protein product [Trichobilharzia regenti]
MYNSKTNATSKPLKESLIDGVHLIVDDDDGEEEEIEVFTKGTVQTTKFIHPLEDNLQLQPQEGNITHQNGSSNANMKKPLMNSNYDDNADGQYSSSILRKDFKDEISTQIIKFPELCSATLLYRDVNTGERYHSSNDYMSYDCCILCEYDVQIDLSSQCCCVVRIQLSSDTGPWLMNLERYTKLGPIGSKLST